MNDQSLWRRAVYVTATAICATALFCSWVKSDYRYQPVSHSSSLFVFDKDTGKYYTLSGVALPLKQAEAERQ